MHKALAFPRWLGKTCVPVPALPFTSHLTLASLCLSFFRDKMKTKSNFFIGFVTRIKQNDTCKALAQQVVGAS